MRALLAVAGCGLVLGVVGLAQAQEKKDDKPDHAAKIVGTWEIVKAGGDVGPGSTLDFAKDGKCVMTVKSGEEMQKLEGTYTIKKDKLTITLKVGDMQFDQTLTIKKLMDDDMELVDEKDMVDVLKRKKEKEKEKKKD